MNQSKSHNSFFWAGMVGNILDHYDMALYTFLVPFIAPVFFPGNDHVVQLIMAYSITAISIIARPLGSIIFGNMAMRLGAKFVLILTLAGVACSTCIIGFIPGYDSIGIWGAIILIIVRFIQGVFAAGELSVSGLFVLDQVQVERRAKASSYYIASSMTGAMIASAVAWLVSWSGQGEIYWRYAFVSGIVTGLIGLVMRYIVLDGFTPQPIEKIKLHKIVIKYRFIIFQIILVSSVSYMTFSVPFIFLNKFIPLLTDITLTQMMGYNSIMMLLDILLLPVAGHIAQKYNIAKWMASMAMILAVTAIPGFYMLDKVPFYGILAIKLWFVVVGLAFAAPLKAWLFSLINTGERYMITGLGYSIGTEVLGRQTNTICWVLWYQTGSVIGPACYMSILSISAVWALLQSQKL